MSSEIRPSTVFPDASMDVNPSTACFGLLPGSVVVATMPMSFLSITKVVKLPSPSLRFISKGSSILTPLHQDLFEDLLYSSLLMVRKQVSHYRAECIQRRADALGLQVLETTFKIQPVNHH